MQDERKRVKRKCRIKTLSSRSPRSSRACMLFECEFGLRAEGAHTLVLIRKPLLNKSTTPLRFFGAFGVPLALFESRSAGARCGLHLDLIDRMCSLARIVYGLHTDTNRTQTLNTRVFWIQLWRITNRRIKYLDWMLSSELQVVLVQLLQNYEKCDLESQKRKKIICKFLK